MRQIIAPLVLFFIFSPLNTQAQTIKLPDPPMPEILRFSLSPVTETCTNNDDGTQDCYYIVQWIGEYISQFYVFAVGVASILAVVVIMVAGFVWTMAGGNTSQVDNAKGYIKGAVTGLILMLGSYTLLYTINPKLVEFDGLRIPVVKRIDLDELSAQLGGFEGRCSIKTVTAGLHPALTSEKADIINEVANNHGIDPFVVAAFISRETTFNFCDRGINAGCNNKEFDALGAMQVLPTTAAEVWNLKTTSNPPPAICLPPYEVSSNTKPLSKNGIAYAYRPECKQFIASNPKVQAELGTAYLAKLDRFLKDKGVENNLALLSAAYFAGPGNAEKLINDGDGSVIADMPKTKQYTDAMQSIYKNLCTAANGEILTEALPSPAPTPTP